MNINSYPPRDASNEGDARENLLAIVHGATPAYLELLGKLDAGIASLDEGKGIPASATFAVLRQ